MTLETLQEVNLQATYNLLRTEIVPSTGRAMTHYEICDCLKLSDGKAKIYRAAFEMECEK